jgi:hypothetical protein
MVRSGDFAFYDSADFGIAAFNVRHAVDFRSLPAASPDKSVAFAVAFFFD